MKIRRLSEIDLARIAPLPPEEKLHRLRLLKIGRPPHTYNPLRFSLGDILNLQPEMFPPSSEYTSWAQISDDISKRATSETEKKFNLAVGRALHDYGVAVRARSFSKPISSWAVGYGQSVRFWWNLYTVIRGRPCFIFADPRISSPLTRVGRRFVLSIMNERIRVADPDFANAKLVVVQFGKGEQGNRIVREFEAADSELFSFSELNAMIDETYRLWVEILTERTEEVRKRPSGSNPFGF
jgi:hypothetical protein